MRDFTMIIDYGLPDAVDDVMYACLAPAARVDSFSHRLLGNMMQLGEEVSEQVNIEARKSYEVSQTPTEQS